MPGKMDERVVSLEFDNKKFEKNVRTSMHTLDELKESLDFDGSADSLETLDKQVKKFGKNTAFKDMDDSVSSLRKGFGLLGNSAGNLFSQFAQATKLVAILDLATAAVRRLEASIKSMTIVPISQGFQKYTTKIGSIKTIANATGLAAEEVNKALEGLNWFTDETSASFENMVSNIGKFTSVGRGLSESITAMEGIATWGYQSGAGVEEINRAMYNLSQALGTGSVKLMDWKSIENAGMATKEFKEQALAAAEAAGTLKRKGDKLFAGNQEVTAENFNSTLAKGWFTSDVLMRTLEVYGGFAVQLREFQKKNPQYQLASEAMAAMDIARVEKEAQTLAELAGKAVDEVNAELERIGKDSNGNEEKRLESIQEYVETLKEEVIRTLAADSKRSMVEIEKDITSILDIQDLKEREKRIKKLASDSGIELSSLTKYITALAEAEESLGEKAFKSSQQSKSFRDALEATKDAVSTGWMNTFQKIFGGLDESISLWTDVTEILWELFASGADMRNNALNHWAEELGGRDDLWGEKGIMHSIMDTIIDLKGLLGSTFKDVFFPALYKTIGDYDESETIGLVTGAYTVSELRYKREGSFWGNEIKKITGSIKKFGETIRDFFTNEDNLDKIQRTVAGIMSVFKLVWGAISGFFRMIGRFVKESGIFQDILGIFAAIGDKIRYIVDKIERSGFITTLFEKIGNTLVWFYKLVKGWVTQIIEFFEETGIGQAIRDFFGGILEWFIGGENDIDESGEKMESGFFRAFGWLRTVKDWLSNINLKDILYDIKFFFDNIGTIWTAFTGGISGEKIDRSGMDDKLIGFVDFAEGFGEKISGVVNFFKRIYEKVVGWLEDSGILPTIRKWWDNIVTFFQNIGLVWDTFVRGKEIDPRDLTDKQNNLLAGIRRFIDKIKGVYEKVKNAVMPAIDWVKEKWTQFVGWLESSGILPKVRQMWKNVKNFFSNLGLLWDIFVRKQGVYDPKDLTEDQLDIVQKIERFIKRVQEKFEWIKNKFIQIKDTVVGWLEDTGILPTLRGWWADIVEWFNSLSVPNPDGEGGPLESVKRFFAGLWETISGWFGGDKPVEVPSVAGEVSPENLIGEGTGTGGEPKKKGFFSGIFETVGGWFTNDEGKFSASKGLKEIIGKVFSFFTETLGGLDWQSAFDVVKNVLVVAINSLDDALGEIHYDNILRVVGEVFAVFTGFLTILSTYNVIKIVRSFQTKGKSDKSIFEKAAELISALGTAILQFGIAILLISASMWIISKIDPLMLPNVLAIVTAIAAVFVGILAVCILMTKDAKRSKRIVDMLEAVGNAFLYIGVAIGLIVLSIIAATLLFKFAKWDDIWKALVLIAGIIIVMSAIVIGMAWATKKVGTLRISAGIAAFTGIAILIATVTVCILLLQMVDLAKGAAYATLLSGVLLAIAGAIRLMDKIKISTKTMVVMLMMSILIAIFTAAVILMKNIKIEKIVVITAAILVFLYGMVKIAQALEKVKPGAVKGAVYVAIIAVIFAAAAAAVALIVTYTLDLMADALLRIMSTLAAAGVSAALIDYEAIEKGLELLGTIGEKFIELNKTDPANALYIANSARYIFTALQLSGIAARGVDKKAITDIVGEDGTGGLLSSISTALSSVTDIGDNATLLGANMERLSNSLLLAGTSGASIDAQGIGNIKDRLGDIDYIVKTALALGTNDISGETIDLTKLSEGIANIGAALQLYNVAVTDFEGQALKVDELGNVIPISTEQVTRAIQSVVGILSSTEFTYDASAVENVESWASLDSANNSEFDATTKFAVGLATIANAMVVFSDQAKKYDEGAGGKAINALGLLTDIYTKIKDADKYDAMIGNVAGWGTQPSDTATKSTFANSLVGMGVAMTAFSEVTKSVDHTSVQNAIGAINQLIGIYTILEPYEDKDLIAPIEKTATDLKGGSGKKSAQEVFKDFSTGVTYLAQGLVGFGETITANEESLKSEKIDMAIGILETIIGYEERLAKVTNQEFMRVVYNLFGSSSDKSDAVGYLGSLGKSIGDLGARLVTFANQITGGGVDENAFKLDPNSELWQNVAALIDYLVSKTSELAALIKGNEEEVVGKEWVIEYGLKYIGDHLTGLATGLGKFSDTMFKTYHVNSKVYKTGDWGEDSWNNVKLVLDYFMNLVELFRDKQFQASDFSKIDNFGHGIEMFCERLNYNDRFKIFFETVWKIMDASSRAEATAKAFSYFMESIETMAGAASVLHGYNVNADDVSNITTLLEGILELKPEYFDKFNTHFNKKGVESAGSFVSAFFDRLTATESEDGKTIDSTFNTLLEKIASYAESNEFYNRGKIAGEQYALGFDSGISGTTFGHLTPIVSMSNNGSVSTGAHGDFIEVMKSMSFGSSVSPATQIITNVESIKNRLNSPITTVDTQTAEVVTAIGRTNDRLNAIGSTVGALRSDVRNLKVYINSKILAGAIAPDIDRELGRIGGMRNVTPRRSGP